MISLGLVCPDGSLGLPLLPLVNVFVFDLLLRDRTHSRSRHFLLLVLEHILDAGPSPGVHHVGPLLRGVGGQLLPPLDDEDTGVTYLAYPGSVELEASQTVFLVLPAVCEP